MIAHESYRTECEGFSATGSPVKPRYWVQKFAHPRLGAVARRGREGVTGLGGVRWEAQPGSDILPARPGPGPCVRWEYAVDSLS